MKFNSILIAAFISFLFIIFSSCKTSLKEEYDKKHEKYRTLMYRTNLQKCFVDSCRKYGLLYDSIVNMEINGKYNLLDTVPLNEPTPDCK